MSGDVVKNVLDLRKALAERERKEGEPLKEFEIKPHVYVEAKNLDDLYFQTVTACLKHGRLYYIDTGSFVGSHRIEFDSVSLCTLFPTTRPLAPQSRPGIPCTTNDDKIEEYFLNYIMDGSLKPNEHYRYSSWITGMPERTPLTHKNIPRGTKLNQLEWCINHFVDKGYGQTHAAITIGCAEGLKRYDWEEKSDAEKGSTECLRQISLKIKNNKLNLSCFFRSWDLFAGLPENLGGLTRLMEYTTESINERAKDLGKDLPIIQPGYLFAHSDGLHIYEHNIEVAKLWAGLSELKK